MLEPEGVLQQKLLEAHIEAIPMKIILVSKYITFPDSNSSRYLIWFDMPKIISPHIFFTRESARFLSALDHDKLNLEYSETRIKPY